MWGLNGKLKGKVKIRVGLDKEVVGEVLIGCCAVWAECSAHIAVPEGIHPLYFEYEESSRMGFSVFTLK